MPIDRNEITKEQIAKAMQCKSAEELIAFAKSEKRKPRRTLMSYQSVN